MLNAKWSSYVKKCQLDWYSPKFEYLRHLPGYHLYLTLLERATSVNHLETMQKSLPLNFHLLNDDWIAFKNFWRSWFAGNGLKKHRNELLEWLLFEQSVCWDEAKKLYPTKTGEEQRERVNVSTPHTPYYAERIRQGATKTSPIHFSENNAGGGSHYSAKRILSCPERSGNGDRHFQMRLFDEIFEVGFHLNKDKSHMLVRFRVEQNRLTEELTYKMISQLPTYYIFRYGVSMGSQLGGTYLNLAFEIETGELINLLKPFEHGEMIAEADFASAVAPILREAGLPIEGDLSPIMMKSPCVDKGVLS